MRFLVALVVLVCACRGPRGDIRLVSRTPDGGVYAFEDDRDVAMRKAEERMAEHCGSGEYRVIQEGEEVVGTSMSMNRRRVSTDTEWRVHYVCRSPQIR